MSFLPIVHRELRTASRRKGTYLLRWWTALVAIVVNFFGLMIGGIAGGRGGIGDSLFSFLTGYTFVLCLLAGVLFTADTLSEEKREGTLGLLFLTDLRGYDVVIGKFFASSLNSFYGLMALLPITALPMLLGGVTPGEFWRVALALVNALFFSLAAGIGFSAFMRDSKRVMTLTLLFLVALCAGVPLLTQAALKLGAPQPLLLLGWFSPFTAFSNARELSYLAKPGDFWWSLLDSHLFGWAFIAISSVALPRIWQERGREEWGGTFGRWLRAAKRSPQRRARARAILLPRNPVLWLLNEEGRIGWAVWAVVGAWIFTTLALSFFEPSASVAAMTSAYVVIPFGFLLKTFFAFQACRFFSEGRRNGALELLLCTPLTNQDILRGQSRALWRNFLPALIVFLIFLFAPTVIQLIRGLISADLDIFGRAIPGAILGGVYCVRFTADLFAISWVGAWLALSMKKPQLAPARTVLTVLLLPSLLCYLDIIPNLILMAWSLSRLQVDLRWLLGQQYEMPTTVLPTLPPRIR